MKCGSSLSVSLTGYLTSNHLPLLLHMQRKGALQKLQTLYRYTKPKNSGLAKIEYRYGEVGQEGEPSIPIMHFRLTDNKNLIFLSYLPSFLTYLLHSLPVFGEHK